MCYISNVVSSGLMDESNLPDASVDSNKLTKENSSQDTSPKKVCLTKITLLILRMRVMKKELRKESVEDMSDNNIPIKMLGLRRKKRTSCEVNFMLSSSDMWHASGSLGPIPSTLSFNYKLYQGKHAPDLVHSKVPDIDTSKVFLNMPCEKKNACVGQ
ncbi:unnamed protein product [Citrullus colocynthis]|uniref:Uncharacterized protein n=1 Tax=Citrullus colocynthis TaxID=252529 RepID=A0ABP0ZAT8_9ROSI